MFMSSSAAGSGDTLWSVFHVPRSTFQPTASNSLKKAPTFFILTGARQDVVLVEVHFVGMLGLQVRFENEVDELPVVLVVHVGDVGIVQLAVCGNTHTHTHTVDRHLTDR